MANRPSPKRVIFENKKQKKYSHTCPRLIYDDPFVFRVRSDRVVSDSYPCYACLKEIEEQEAAKYIRYERRCSRLPFRPVEIPRSNRPRTVPSKRSPKYCSWDNFMKETSKYAIQTPHAQCELSKNEQDSENRPPFINYGGSYQHKRIGEKRTFNSLIVHQLKHDEIEENRVLNVFRERRLRREAEDYFREMQRRKFGDQNRCQSSQA